MSDNSSGPSDKLPAWSVRDVPADVRTAANVHAKKAGIGVGEWVALAIRDKIKADRSRGKSIAVRGAGPVDANAAARAVDMIGQLAAAGVAPSKAVQRDAQSLMRRVLADVKQGRTDRAGGQTAPGATSDRPADPSDEASETIETDDAAHVSFA